MEALEIPAINCYPVSLKKYLVIISIQVLFNIIVFPFLLQKYPEPMFNVTIFNSFFTFPIVSLLGGVIIALVPFRKLKYKAKYWPSVLFFYFILNSVVTIATLIGLGRFAISGELLDPAVGLFGPLHST